MPETEEKLESKKKTIHRNPENSGIKAGSFHFPWRGAKSRLWTNFVLVSVSIFVVLSLMYLVARHLLFSELSQRAVGVALATASGVDLEDLDRIRTAEDIDKPEYVRVQSFLKRISDSNQDVVCLCMIRPVPTNVSGRVRYVYVADDKTKDLNGNDRFERDEVRHLPGALFNDSSHGSLNKARYHPVADTNSYFQSLRHVQISAYSPIKDARGDTVAVVSVGISSDSVRKRLAHFQISTLAVWALLSVLAFFFSGITRKRWVGYLFVSAIILVLFTFLYMVARRAIISEIRYHAMGVAIATAAGIDPEEVNGIRKAEDAGKASYFRIQAFMQRIADTNMDVRYVYIMRKSTKADAKATDYEYVVDEATFDQNGNGAIDPEEVGNPPGAYYDASSFPQLLAAWYQPAADLDVTPDPPYPDLMSGYAPIKDKHGHTVALVGVDVIAEVVGRKLLAIRTVILIVYLTLTLLTIAVLQLYFQKRALLEERDELISELEKSRERYKLLSITDELTKLYNQRHFGDQLTEETHRALRYGHPLSLLLMDIDDFKLYNDTHGHAAGDMVLEELGRVIKQELRASDSAYRYGGEEFIILLPETDAEQAVSVADRLRKDWRETALSREEIDNAGRVTLSIGIAAYNPGEDPAEFVKRADGNMYTAKRLGKDRIVFA
ncbi:MAG: diguanylate cyclase [Deltaproteobacteria bacterium]|nr:diguanylate cyclase [Deltaproteobacteria bacterium]